MQNMKKLVGIAVSAGMLLGCATPYRRMGGDTEVAPGVVRIEVKETASTDVDTLENHFHQRAAAIFRPRNHDWRLDSEATRGPGSVIANRYGHTLHVNQQPSPATGWGSGDNTSIHGHQEPS